MTPHVELLKKKVPSMAKGIVKADDSKMIVEHF